MAKKRRWRVAVGGAAVAALAIGMLIPASAASAYAFTNCSWSTGGSGNITWQNNTGVYYSDTAVAAAASWANYTDVNDMTPSGGTMVVSELNNGANGLDGETWWVCANNRTTSASVTLNPHYTDNYFNNQKKAVWVHEFGHALGLAHSSAGTIMFHCPSCSFRDYQIWWPATDDVNGMNALY
ncbi:matrixin family metalloprotease [Microbacterium sp. NPDC087665]|uniref:matrixin family metalloprotease n=1 Tax=Microbacterium sp. NPDC087665 TaxID=3364194 RepID=UPI003814F438